MYVKKTSPRTAGGPLKKQTPIVRRRQRSLRGPVYDQHTYVCVKGYVICVNERVCIKKILFSPQWKLLALLVVRQNKNEYICYIYMRTCTTVSKGVSVPVLHTPEGTKVKPVGPQKPPVRPKRYCYIRP